MTTQEFVRARVEVLDNKEKSTGRQLYFDFNPETLSFKVKHETKAPERNSRQRVQYTGASTIQLSFDAVFDTSRVPGPRSSDEDPGGSTGQVGWVDVREKTRIFTGVLSNRGSAGQAAGSFFPSLIQFAWGKVVFKGVVESFSETLELFSPTGVPLRSKVSVTLGHVTRQYRIDSDAALEQQQAAQSAGGAGDAANTPSSALDAAGLGLDDANALAALNDLDSLFDLSLSASLSLDLSASLDLDLQLGLDIDIGIGLDVDLGVGVDLGISAGAEISAGVSASLEVFGGAAVEVALGVDAPSALRGRGGTSGGGSSGGTASTSTATSGTSTRKGQSGLPASSWAPDGPVPGTRGASLAAAVNQQRAAAAPPPSDPPASTHFRALDLSPTVASAPLPVRGSPPTSGVRLGPPPNTATLRREDPREVPMAALGRHRPSWEGGATVRVRAATTASVTSKSCTSCGGCGCGCSGGS